MIKNLYDALIVKMLNFWLGITQIVHWGISFFFGVISLDLREFGEIKIAKSDRFYGAFPVFFSLAALVVFGPAGIALSNRRQSRKIKVFPGEPNHQSPKICTGGRRRTSVYQKNSYITDTVFSLSINKFYF